MATISKSWGTESTIINAASVTTGTLSSAVDLKTNGYEGAVITISAAFSTTDDLDIEVLAVTTIRLTMTLLMVYSRFGCLKQTAPPNVCHL